MPVEQQVVVVGGGISGLAAAHRLATSGANVTVLEASRHIGGVLRVSDVAGLPVDEGAESLLNRRPEAVEPPREVGLGADLAYPAGVGPGVRSRGRIRALPGPARGVPPRPDEVLDDLVGQARPPVAP